MGSHARLTPREVLGFFGKLNGITGPRLSQRIDEMVKMFDFGDYADTKIDKLSTGMKQKVAIGGKTSMRAHVAARSDSCPATWARMLVLPHAKCLASSAN